MAYSGSQIGFCWAQRPNSAIDRSGERSQDGVGGFPSGLDCGLGVERAKVVAREMDPFRGAGKSFLDAAAPRKTVGEAERPPAHMRLDDMSGEAGEDVVEVVEITVDDLAVVEIEQGCGECGGRENHNAAARLALPFMKACEAGHVEEDVECPFWGRDSVAPVPRLRLCLVCEEGGADVGTVDNLPERFGCLRGEAGGELACNRSWRGEHAVAGLDVLLGIPAAVPHADAVFVLDGLQHFGAENDARAETGADRLGKGRGSTNDVAGEPGLAIPDEPEVPNASPRRHLFWGPC